MFAAVHESRYGPDSPSPAIGRHDSYSGDELPKFVS
jgi:hypothetical protein